jgi:hypothetical protein
MKNPSEEYFECFSHQILTRGRTMKRKKRLVDRGEASKVNYPFLLISKGGRENKGMETRRKNICMEIGGAMVTRGA